MYKGDKAVLVLDIPKDCSCCSVISECYNQTDRIYQEEESGKRPDWCPLVTDKCCSYDITWNRLVGFLQGENPLQ